MGISIAMFKQLMNAHMVLGHDDQQPSECISVLEIAEAARFLTAKESVKASTNKQTRFPAAKDETLRPEALGVGRLAGMRDMQPHDEVGGVPAGREHTFRPTSMCKHRMYTHHSFLAFKLTPA